MEYSLSGFNGQRPDPVSGHSHLGNGYRAYSPALGRFAAPDSWSPFGAGGINPYAYCAGDPVNRADPSGHFSLGQGIGIVLGVLAGIALSALTEGLALGPALSLLANVVGDAAIGAGSELVGTGIDGQRVNWGQVGIAAGAGALTSLVFNGAGLMGSKLRGTSNRPFGGWMMEGGYDAGVGSFRGPRHLGFGDDGFDFVFEDTTRDGQRRLNIVIQDGVRLDPETALNVRMWDANTGTNRYTRYPPTGGPLDAHLRTETGENYPVYRLGISRATRHYTAGRGRRGPQNFVPHFSRHMRGSTIEASHHNVILGGAAYEMINEAARNIQLRGAADILDGNHGQQILDVIAANFEGQGGVFNIDSEEWLTYRNGLLRR
jgi:RHS repeat-associated protein